MPCGCRVGNSDGSHARRHAPAASERVGGLNDSSAGASPVCRCPCVAAVVFAETRGGIDLQDLCHARRAPASARRCPTGRHGCGSRRWRPAHSILPRAVASAASPARRHGAATRRAKRSRPAKCSRQGCSSAASLSPAYVHPGQLPAAPAGLPVATTDPPARRRTDAARSSSANASSTPGSRARRGTMAWNPARQYRREAAIALAPQHPVCLATAGVHPGCCVHAAGARASSMASALISRGRRCISAAYRRGADAATLCSAAAPAAGPR